MITFKPGNVFVNKTYLYLKNILNTFDTGFIQKYALVRDAVLAYAIQDFLYNDAKGIEHTESVLFVVIDMFGRYNSSKGCYDNPTNGCKAVTGFLSYFKSHPSYVHDYVFDSVKRPTKHCVAIYLGKDWKHSYEAFTRSEYDKIFNPIELNKCRITPKNGANKNAIYEILVKDKNYLPTFKKKLETVFNLRSGELDSMEDFPQYELPLKMEDETLNFRKTD